MKKMLQVSELFVYPVKSLGGIRLQTATLTSTGFKYDRLWMLVDADNTFITQRQIPQLALFNISMSDEKITIQFGNQAIDIFKNENNNDIMHCNIWGEQVQAIREDAAVNQWFSDILNTKVSLVRKTGVGRPVNNHPDWSVNFPDAHQYLILGENSLHHLNEKLSKKLPVNRFRPNIVFTGGQVHIEDDWQEIQIGDSRFAITKACGRCKITTNDQASGIMSTEPLKTLSTYRQVDNKVLFGQYLKLLSSQNYEIRIGDLVSVIKEK
ncbi:MAG TPA: MOSC domain-containing protein [Chitinophagaceae bacterium]|nr:MOSC domain-containing protein [Chitinophagaceae bacterium]